MNECSVCKQGKLEESLVETWMHRGERWVLIRNVPGVVCDTCGDKSFSQEAAERLARLLSRGSSEAPTDLYRAAVFDLEVIEKEENEGRRPAVSSTDISLPEFLRLKKTTPVVYPSVTTEVHPVYAPH